MCLARPLLQLPAITAVYAGSEQLPAAVEAAVRAQQNNATSVSLALAAARILEKVGVGWATCMQCIDPVQQHLQTSRAAVNESAHRNSTL